MKKLFTIFAVALCSTLAMAQTNQYFWYNGNFIIGNPISQIDSITFGDHQNTDSVLLFFPHTVQYVHDTIIRYVTDTVFVPINNDSEADSIITNGHEYVDLDLPSGLLWATMNLGASSPQQYKNEYYAWGETTPKVTYSWSTYKHCQGTNKSITKYCNNSTYGTVDNKMILDIEDDAARAEWGGNWYIPSNDDWKELMDSSNCTWTWKVVNEVRGCEVKSVRNGNTIFLSAAEYKTNNYFQGAQWTGYYWASNLFKDTCDLAVNLAISAFWDKNNFYWMEAHSREHGFSIRPVCKKVNNNCQPDTVYINKEVFIHDTAFVTIHDTINPCAVPEGAISGKFSVSETKQVYFSKGNLQYQASTDTWRFAEKQYEYVGSNNQYISSTYSSWIDLFGWGTGNNPTLSSTNPLDYSSFSEFGDNVISGASDGWYTMTKDEWLYLLQDRANANMLNLGCTVNGQVGLLILPDNWVAPKGIVINTDSLGYSSNSFTLEDWQTLEQQGCAFLPAAGYRLGKTDSGNNCTTGAYLTASPDSISNLHSYELTFGEETMKDVGTFYHIHSTNGGASGRCVGRSVRLVQEVK